VIRAIVELELTYPYSEAIFNLLDFCMLWDCSFLAGGANNSNAVISIPSDKFKQLFGNNPQKGKYAVPKGAEYFMEEIIVKGITV